jgi:hypothetical protein
MVVHVFHTKPANSWIVQPLSPVDRGQRPSCLRHWSELHVSLALLNAALEDAAVNKPLLFFFLRELIWYYSKEFMPSTVAGSKLRSLMV